MKKRDSVYRKEYISRINKAIDYIEQNIDNALNLDDISQAANFSKFHFHRIFSAFTGETLNNYVKRRRLEKAASYILAQPELTVTEIAYKCGFSSISSFSRAFQEWFGMSATAFSGDGYETYSKNRKLNGKNGKIDLDDPSYFCGDKNKYSLNKMKMEVKIKEMPEFFVAYCRHSGPFNQIDKAYNKLFAWAGPRGLIQFPETKMLTAFHDDPAVTEEEKLLQSACMTIPKGTKTEGEIGTMIVKGGKYAVAHFEIAEAEFQAAWDSVMEEWLPDSGYQCDDKYPYELYYNHADEHPEKKFILDICIPVRAM
jgi:AraC family transcriptional regulator